jgi:uncharacterized protein YqeY
VIDRMIKQRRDSIAQFDRGGRTDLSDKERQELTVLQAYMPEALSQGDVDAAIAAAIASTGAASAADMGKVMALLKPQLAGRTDLASVSAMVKARLSQRAD